MNNYMELYQTWMDSPKISKKEKEELASIAGKDKAIKDRFAVSLAFGTAGLRGIMGAGTNRMNAHIVRQTTQAICNLIISEGPEAVSGGVAVCYDSRNRSEEFAREAASVFAGNGIPTRIFDALRPTPELSFAIREYGLTAGINITASHNPKEYNGYKVYWNDGAQLPSEHAERISREMEKIDVFKGIIKKPYNKAVEDGNITILGEQTDHSFLDVCLCLSPSPETVAKVADTFKLVYTPFHGTGHKLVPRALERLGFKHIICVPEQMVIDGNFPTVKSPNPEEKAGFALAIELAKRENATLVIGTDPDADRVGVVARTKDGEFINMTGNQIGVLLLDYLIKAHKEKNPNLSNLCAIKTIVTTEMAREVCKKHNIKLYDTFTGFKYIAEKLNEIEGNEHYILAFEESYGYLTGNHCRDKDAITASIHIAEMAAWYYTRGMTLTEAMEELYKEYGYFEERTVSITMPGLEGMAKMEELMRRLRSDPPVNVAGTKLTAFRDYLRGERYDIVTGDIERLPIKGSNVLYWELEDGTSFIVRPSGTEPKIKVYILTSGKDKKDCDYKVEIYRAYAEDIKNV